MSIQLSRTDFQKLTQIVQDLPTFAIERDRRQLVAGALEGIPRANTMLTQLNLGGAPMTAAVEVIRFLAAFGQVAHGKEALGVFLNYVLQLSGEENAAFIACLFDSYPLDALVSHDHPIDTWRGTDNLRDVQEKIVGENTLRHIRFLELALDAARAVVHLRVIKQDGRLSFGTGFMIAPDLLMTNNHVISTADEAISAEYSFNYQLDRVGRLLDVVPARTMPNGLFHTNPDLDYTVIQLAEKSGHEFGTLKLQAALARKDDRVTIIQHPGGHLKKISIQNNLVAYADQRVVQYTTSTLPGSSGSPVLDDNCNVIAIHHSGGILNEPGTGQYYLRNAGTSMIAVLGDLKKQSREIYTQFRNQ